MPKYPLPSSTETDFETQLRATLQEAAPSNIDLEQGWSRVAESLPISRQYTHALPKTAWGWFSRSHDNQKLRRAPVFALALFIVAFVGAGVTGVLYFWHGPIVDRHLYQDIGQKQSAQGVTIQLNYGYVDQGSTWIEYDLQVDSSLAKHYGGAFVGSYNLTDQFGEESAGGTTQCTAYSQDTGVVHCLIIDAPFHPAAGTDQLTITLDVTKIYLMTPGVQSRTDILTGNWHFQFTLTFHKGKAQQDAVFPQATYTR